MSDRLQSANNPEFSPGEAEEMVRRVRREFLAAASKHVAGDLTGAVRAERKANDSLEQLRRRLELYLDRQIHRQIPFASAGEREDAIAELQYRVLMSVKDTHPSLSAEHWERRFNQCVQRRAIDICRPIQKRYGYGATIGLNEDFPAPVGSPREVPFSSLGNDAEPPLLDRLPDGKAERAMEAVLGAETLRQLISRLGPTQRDHLRFWWRQDSGETWEKIGASEGILSDAARKRTRAVLQSLRKSAAYEPRAEKGNSK